MICPKDKCVGVFKMIKYKMKPYARKSVGVFQCQECGYKEVIE